MKILVTGGAGFIGTNLIKRLLQEGHQVSSLDNYESGCKENEVEGCKYHSWDIEAIFLMDKDFDLIYHLAALSRIQPSFTNPEETYRVNTTGTLAVCKFADKIGAKVVYAGSSSRWHNPLQSPYACSKHMGEEIVKMYKQVYNLDAEITRFYNVYGPGEIVDGDWAAVIGIWRRQVRNKEAITIVGDGEQRRDFTHVSDVVQANILAATKDIDGDFYGELYNVGNGINYSINEIANSISENQIKRPTRLVMD